MCSVTVIVNFFKLREYLSKVIVVLFRMHFNFVPAKNCFNVLATTDWFFFFFIMLKIPENDTKIMIFIAKKRMSEIYAELLKNKEVKRCWNIKKLEKTVRNSLSCILQIFKSRWFLLLKKGCLKFMLIC